MNPSFVAIAGLSMVVVLLIAALVYALLRFASAARKARRHLRENTTESAFVTAALHEALTKLKAQEREMSARAEASERLNSEIVDSLSSGLLLVDRASRIRIVNPAGRRLLKLPESAVGYPYRQVVPEALALAIEECIRSSAPIIRRKLFVGDAPAFLGVSVSPLTDAEGEPHGVICLFTDLTPAVEMEEQLRLKESLAQVGELTAGIAHEFRNGLATIHGYARLLDLEAVPPAFHPHVLGIRQEADALGEVVTNFLNFAKPSQLTLAPVDLRAIAERAIDEVGAEARAGGGHVAIRGDFPVIQGDDVLLRQAFSNLLRNAVQACAGASVAPHVVVEGRLEAGHVRVSIDDNGPGIPAADRDRIFRPFVTTKSRGTGLGLALVQKIVVTHNGRIHVAAAPGGGASMQVVLPLAPD
jgi:two-component system sensor histidine kinase PilS (NtrC family)